VGLPENLITLVCQNLPSFRGQQVQKIFPSLYLLDLASKIFSRGGVGCYPAMAESQNPCKIRARLC